MAAAPFGLKLPPDAELQPSNAVPKKPTQTPSSFRRVLQRTRPQSLAYAMVDNPVAQAAWIVERLHDWADLRGAPVRRGVHA